MRLAKTCVLANARYKAIEVILVVCDKIDIFSLDPLRFKTSSLPFVAGQSLLRRLKNL